jgi:hypothetical protein
MLYETVGMSTLPIPLSPPGEESATVVTGGDDHVHNGDHEHDNAGGFMSTNEVAEFFNGHIASYNVYNKALTGEQVHALYRDTLTGNPCALSVEQATDTELFGAQGQGQGSDSVNTVKVNMNPDAPDPTEIITADLATVSDGVMHELCFVQACEYADRVGDMDATPKSGATCTVGEGVSFGYDRILS